MTEAQVQVEDLRDKYTVSKHCLEVFLSEMEQKAGAVSNTTGDARDFDRGEDNNPDNPLLGRPSRISLKLPPFPCHEDGCGFMNLVWLVSCCPQSFLVAVTVPHSMKDSNIRWRTARMQDHS